VNGYSEDFALTDGVTVEGSDISISFDKNEIDTVATTDSEFSFGSLRYKAVSTTYLLEKYTVKMIVKDRDGNGVA